jgi:uncharacterized phage-like protein YoqJ
MPNEGVKILDKVSCVIAGHNPQRFKFKYNEQAPMCKKIKSAIAEQIKTLYSEGVQVFYVGCGVGVDTWAAEIVLELRQQVEFLEIELFCAVPFADHSAKFTDGQKERYKRILNQCTHQEVVSRKYSPTAYKRLNYFMVDNSQYFVAVYDQDRSERSGLGQMVNYAIKNNLQITFIHPDTATTSKYESE